MASPSSIPPLPDHVRIRIMSPGADVPPNFTIDIPSSSTIDDLKHQIQAGIDVKPTPDQQRLIYRGKVLEGGATVQTAVVGAAGAINARGSSAGDMFTVHLVIRPGAGTSTSTATQSMATSAATSQVQSQIPTPTTSTPAPSLFAGTAPVTAGPGVVRTTRVEESENGSTLGRIEERVERQSREIMAARGESHGVGDAMSASVGEDIEGRGDEDASLQDRSGIPPPPLGGSQIPTSLPASTSSDPTADARRRALDDYLAEMTAADLTFAAATLPPPFTPFTTSGPSPITIPPHSSLYLLQDPSGRPHSLLIGPPNLSPLPTLPTISSHPQQPQPQAALAAQLELLRRELELLDARHNRVRGDPPLNLFPQQQQQVQAPLADVAARIRGGTQHFWLAMKLAIFVFFFSGQGGWGRVVYLSCMALGIWVWQTGLWRVIVATLNPAPPLVGVDADGVGGQGGVGVGGQGQGGELDPARTARMLIQRRRETAGRRVVRVLERSVGIFLASLVPGLHERHVENVERQERGREQVHEGVDGQQQVPVPGQGEGEGAEGLRERRPAGAVDDGLERMRGMGMEMPAGGMGGMGFGGV